MANFLRDERLSNLTIDKDALAQVANIFANRASALNEEAIPNDPTARKPIIFFVIRFDSKGYRVFTIEALLQYFQQAKVVERIIMNIETAESIRTNRNIGTYLELRFDAGDPNLCYLTVTSNESDWVDASFSAVSEILRKFKNRNGLARTQWMEMLIQIGGVFFGFVLSLWAAFVVAPKVSIENSFVICFLFALLIFSNTWTYLKGLLYKVVYKYFPNIKFYRSDKDRIHWLMQVIIGGIALAITLYLLNLAFSFVGDFLGNLLSKGL